MTPDANAMLSVVVTNNTEHPLTISSGSDRCVTVQPNSTASGHRCQGNPCMACGRSTTA